MRKSTSTKDKATAGVKKGPWTPEEDEILANYVRREGEGRWRTLPKRAGLLRCGKSCRLRWMNYLRPSVKRGRIAPDEEDLILRLHRLLGNRWSLIAGRLPGRTDNEIKNYWNTHLSKKLINQGIDPRTHKPLLTHPNPNPNPNPDLSTSSTAILSTDPNPNPFPNLNPNLSFSAGLESLESERALVANHVSNPSPDPRTLVVENKEGNSSDHYPQEYRVANNCNQTSWNHSDGTLMGLQSTHGNYGNQDNCIGYFNDDIFSTFLTSLINEEDVFKNQQPEHTNMMTVPSSSTQPVMPSMHMQVSNHGMAAWEASLQQASNMQPTFSYEWNGFNNQFA